MGRIWGPNEQQRSRQPDRVCAPLDTRSHRTKLTTRGTSGPTCAVRRAPGPDGVTLGPVNLILLQPEELDRDGVAVLCGRRAAHLTDVLGAREGEHLRVGTVRGPTGEATVTAIRRDVVELSVRLAGDAPAEPALDLILALPRPKVLSRTLQTAAAWGVRTIDLVNTWRVQKSYFNSARLAPDALHRDLVLGCEQGAVTWVPDVSVHRLLMPYLQQVLAPRLEHEPAIHRLIAHPRTGRFVEAVVSPPAQRRAVVALGPEGGFVSREIESFEALGFVPVTIGSAVLRVEAALSAVLAQVTLLLRSTGSR